MMKKLRPPKKVIYRVQAPDGTPLFRVTPYHVEHTLAVLGYMRLRKELPKINPKDPDEEPRYERFKQWILIGTAEDEIHAQRLSEIQGYKNVTEEVIFLPVQPEPYFPKKEELGLEEEEYDD